MKNKGFSLVELIIVIAIMAILAAAIAPALIRYIDKSRRSDDVAAAETINTAAQAALANEEAYDEIQPAMVTSGSVVVATAPVGSAFVVGNGTSISGGAVTFLSEVNSSTGGTSPNLKYKKGFNNQKPGHWTIAISDSGKPMVFLGTAANGTNWELQPDICKEYK